jgi:hypothetical protein
MDKAMRILRKPVTTENTLELQPKHITVDFGFVSKLNKMLSQSHSYEIVIPSMYHITS